MQLSAWRAAYQDLMPAALLNGRWAERHARAWGRALSGDKPPVVFAAVGDHALLGFCAVAMPSDDPDAGETVAKVVALNVRADAWRSGVGTTLIDEALATFHAGGRHSATLWVLEHNHRARAFYERIGFKLDGAADIFGVTRAPVVRMRMALAVA